MTVETAMGITITRRNSGSNIPPLRRAMYRQTMSETFPESVDPRTPPIKGAMYSNPTDNGDISYGLVSAAVALNIDTQLERFEL